MLNLFPIQWLALLAHFLLRVATAFVLIVLGFRHYRHRHELAQAIRIPVLPLPRAAVAVLILTELVVGTMLLLGFITQLAAIILIIMALKMIVLRHYVPHPSIPSRLMYILLLGIGLSLLITGAGLPAFDLPI